MAKFGPGNPGKPFGAKGPAMPMGGVKAPTPTMSPKSQSVAGVGKSGGTAFRDQKH